MGTCPLRLSFSPLHGWRLIATRRLRSGDVLLSTWAGALTLRLCNACSVRMTLS